jgi:hypothetical protein
MVTLFIEPSFASKIAVRENPEVTVETLAYLVGRDALIGQLSTAFRRLCRGDSDPNALYVESIGTVFGTHLLRGLTDGGASSGQLIGLPTESLQRGPDSSRRTLARTSTSRYLAELREASAILHFGSRPMGELVDLQPQEQRAAFDQMRTAYEGIERRRNEREKTITLPSSIHSPCKTLRISAG